MIGLGIEGTAHTFGAGVVRHDGDDDVEVLANVTSMYRPEEGGIHPREAANHHAENAGSVLARALEDAGVTARELDAVAFSRGPGLGPCLRTAATAGRSLALAAGKPLVGVNHCVAHLEIGRAVTPAEDPILLYASGGNTQVIGHAAGRYRVFGETLDIGIGNCLDKLGRHAGLPFPAGPVLEELARDGDTLLDLPYSIKGMDVAFSGILTAAKHHLDGGARLEDVAFSVQEVTYAMLAEVTERAMAHTGKDEVVLGGGVACNRRLRDMTATMAAERGAQAWWPPNALCVDNGAMIAHAGLLQLAAGGATPLEASGVDQRWRTDEVDVPWRAESARPRAPPRPGTLAQGAEAVVEPATHLGRRAVVKRRLPRGYRHPELDQALRVQRARLEAKLLRAAREAGVRTPLVYALDEGQGDLVMERVDGPLAREALEDGLAPEAAREVLASLGAAAARLHAGGLVHGDLTTSNAVVPDGPGSLVLLDFGLGHVSEEVEDHGTDLHVLMEALEATHDDVPDAWDAVVGGYRRQGDPAVEAKIQEILHRGRYRSMMT